MSVAKCALVNDIYQSPWSGSFPEKPNGLECGIERLRSWSSDEFFWE